MDNKLTDNEIIKALECCNNESESCIGCPLWKINRCTNQLQEFALDLINRQKAELEESQDAHIRTIVEKDAEIERLQDSNRRLRDDMRMMLNNDNGSDQIKSEARKEFAKILINKAKNGIIYAMDIPDYVKEMESD